MQTGFLYDEPNISNGGWVLFDLFEFSSEVVPHLSRFAAGQSERNLTIKPTKWPFSCLQLNTIQTFCNIS